ncbi:single-stranded DNA-binding protein [Actinoplanes sp. KI2]|uniref:single-stranded DNA-binding protein n=1 Tax=Actinoplanes sp. KI2 TaxID=2983315 RepID=UPI0021D573C4|nr:single-stranded DNA-binding protein [Actinoplanes sp. KI2]MCU7722979.1 single-stranded DNA-binding protein [Actinoplanes sp. KI2]
MFETNLVIVGNVLVAPEWRRIPSTGALVANFRVASTARRFDRENDRWVDGHSVRVRVVAWRRLAENVASSVAVGDPVIVSGRLYTRDWKDENGNPRISYEMEAYAIGHDLARGRSRFYRSKAGQGVALLEDGAADAMVAGLSSLPVTDEEAPISFGDGLPDGGEPTFVEPAPIVVGESGSEPGPEREFESEPESERGHEREVEPMLAGAKEPAAEPDEDLAIEVERLVADHPPTVRRTRRTKREPVAA